MIDLQGVFENAAENLCLILCAVLETEKVAELPIDSLVNNH